MSTQLVRITADGRLEPLDDSEIAAIALGHAYGHLVDAIINDDEEQLDWTTFEAPELVIAVRMLRQQRDELVRQRNEAYTTLAVPYGGEVTRLAATDSEAS